MSIRFIRDPWLNLGIHVDHKAPYVDIHLPGLCVRIGDLSSGEHWSKDVADGVWLISDRQISSDAQQSVRRALEET